MLYLKHKKEKTIIFPGTPASSTTKTGRHDIAEILLKVALNTKIQIQIHIYMREWMWSSGLGRWT